MSQKEKDGYLLQSLLNNDSEGILEIYKKYFPMIQAYVLKHDGTTEDAKDVLQKALMQLSLRASSEDFKINSSFGAYLFTICKNLWKRSLKISNQRVTIDKVLPLLSEEKDIAMATLEQEKWELFQEKLSDLSDNCKTILTHVFNKISYQEIAKKLDYASENTVRQRVFKCKAKLKKLIQSDWRFKDLKDL